MKENKLIAEFMDRDEYYQGMSEERAKRIFNYHTSWDWLMPVVGKITRDKKYRENEYREHLMDIVPYGHKEDVYDAVVEFIKQLNKES